MEKLPDDVLLRILSLLPHSDRFSVHLVARRWHRLLQYLWLSEKSLVLRGLASISDRSRVYLPAILWKSRHGLRSVEFADIDFGAVNPFLHLCSSDPVVLESVTLRNCALSAEAVFDGLPLLFERASRLYRFEWISNFLGKPSLGKAPRKYGVVEQPSEPLELLTWPSPSLTAQTLSESLAFAKRLTHLTLENVQMTGFFFLILTRRLAPTLLVLRFKDRGTRLGRQAFIHGILNLVNLEELEVGAMSEVGGGHVIRHLTDEDFAQIGCCLLQLSSLQIQGATKLTRTGLTALMENLPKLQYLAIDFCSNIFQSDLEEAIWRRPKHFPHLRIQAKKTGLRPFKSLGAEVVTTKFEQTFT